MIITPEEKEFFNQSIERIKSSFKSREDELDGIGGSTIGIPYLLAQYDVEKSGQNSGAYLRTLESSLSIGQALRVLESIDSFVEFAKSLIDKSATSPDRKVESNGIDQYCYCTQHQEIFDMKIPVGDEDDWEDTQLVYNYYQLWMLTQSSAFVYRLSLPQKDENTLFINEFCYSAREISQDEFHLNQLISGRFEYNDSRDKGYCGTIEDGCAPSVNYGYLYHKDFRRAFDPLWFNCKKGED